MIQDLGIDVKEMVLSNSSFGPQEIPQLIEAVRSDYAQYGILRDSVAELELCEERSPATSVRLGVCYHLLGRQQQAVDTLSNADGSALALFYLGKSKFVLHQYDEAIEHFKAALGAGYNSDDCAVAIAETQRYNDDAKGALQTLDRLSGAVEQTADYLYNRGATVAALGGNPGEVVALYERAVAADGYHAGALFGLALESDRRGDDEAALELYQRASMCFPTHVGSLLNLGVLYEDNQQFDRATQCYQRILDIYPNDLRAQLFLKDASASGDMYYDEEAQKKRERMTQMLNIPVTDFELSVRSRNCLQKMGIATLGDLTRCTEQELLASKNFGETSLVEIRDMVTAKGLELGQFCHEKPDPEPAFDASDMSPDEQALLERPIADLNLSVRARKCMVRLGINTISELIRKTDDNLLECKNFGVTSLNEVREKLGERGLKLRGD